jgi:hypothetical protein
MEIQLLLTEQDIRNIVDGLGELPLKVAGPVFTKIQQQLIAHSRTADNAQQSKSDE